MSDGLCTCGRSRSDQCWQCCELRDGRMSDIGNMTYGIRANAKDIIDIWMEKPDRRDEFGAKEIHDIREAIYGLSTLLRVIEKQEAA